MPLPRHLALRRKRIRWRRKPDRVKCGALDRWRVLGKNSVTAFPVAELAELWQDQATVGIRMMRALPMPRPIPELTGERVVMSAADPARDAPGYLALYADPRIYAHVGDVRIGTVVEADAELRRLNKIDTISLWLIRTHVDRAIVGRYFLNRNQSEDGSFIVGEGIRIKPDFWRTGIHRDARRLMLRYAFIDLNADCFATRARIGNINMIRSAENYGFERHADEEQGGEMYAVFTLTRKRWLEL